MYLRMNGRDRLPREAQLPAHLHREQPAHQQEEQADEQELDPDDLVIGREDVLADERPVVVMRVRAVGRRGNGRHCVASWAACFIQAANSSWVCTNTCARMR